MAMFFENFYSFRYSSSLVSQVVSTGGPDAQTLATIEATLAQANTAYWQRKYQNAIDLYQHAGVLIYQFLDHNTPLHITGIYSQLSQDPTLFPSLLSVSAAYMNLLPAVTASTLQPPTPPPAQALGTPIFHGTGIRPVIARAATGVAGTLAAAGPVVAEANIAPSTPAVPVTPTRLSTPVLTTPPVEMPAPAQTIALGIPVAGKVVSISWQAGQVAPTAQLQTNIYGARVALTALPDVLLQPQQPPDVALALPHDYYYVIPLGLAECYQALGDYANAEKYYLQTASYQYLNASVEASYVWIQLATLYLDWGNALYQSGDPASALPVYLKVLTPAMTAPTSQLYTLPGLQPAWTVAKQVITNIATAATLGVNPQIISAILDVRQQLIKIAGGLDFWGIWAPSVPIWTFDYLQQVATTFAQYAISAEQNVINFWNNADQSKLTRRQLVDAAAQSQAEVTAAQMQLAASQAQQQVYAAGVSLAQQRATDAQKNATEYQNLSGQWIVHQALQTQLNGGDDGDASQLNAYADAMMSRNYSLSGGRGTLAAAEGLTASRLNQQFEIDSMHRQAAEMNAALVQAQAEQTAAVAQVNAAHAALDAATVRASNANSDLQAFDAQTFTPDVWSRMGNAMLKLYHRYFAMALRAARMMQQAYNFETDQALSLIKTSYSGDEVNGLLGADALMADIQSFTYDLITNTTTKPQPLKQTISLAQRFGFAFENQFRKTGSMDFTTSLYDFDLLYPGTYAGRIQTVEVAVQGIVPPTGIGGTLTNSGISIYRLPSSNWNTTNGGQKFRVQNSEALVISDYSPRNDALVVQTDARMMRIVEGAGVASTWHLEIPPSVNDIDYGAITDVLLTFSYRARYDPGLKSQVLASLTTHPGINAGQRGIPLRWVYPDAFFAFQSSGTLSLTLAQGDFPYNQRSPILTSVGIVVATVGGVSASGLHVRLSTPAHAAAVSATTDANGSIDSGAAASPWVPLASGSALGTYSIAFAAADNPTLVQHGQLNLAPIGNLALVLGYSYTPRA
jgi:multidrug efflux pump subunit AcrA (membrane-fusion protein)